MSEHEQIKYYNRTTEKVEDEKVYGEGAVRWLYQSSLGKLLAPLFTSKWLSSFYGCLQSSFISRHKASKFIADFNIPINDYVHGALGNNVEIEDSYKHFNDFFIRKFRDGKRPFVQGEMLPGMAEARYVGFEKITDDLSFPVKGKDLNIAQLLNEKHVDDFKNGPLLIARLCPVDYHRYHYPDDGNTIDSYSIHGEYHSVNPIALKCKNDIFIKNERRVSIIETVKFGKLAYIEVGAMMVGKIVQSHNESTSHKRGDEKGYFLFGGSTVILVGQEGKWLPSDDILKNTKNNMETYIQLGDRVGSVI